MESVLEALEYKLKGIERRLEDEKGFVVSCIDRLSNHNKQVEFYEATISEYTEALRILRGAA